MKISLLAEMLRNLRHDNPHLTSMEDALNCLNEWLERSNATKQWSDTLIHLGIVHHDYLFEESMSKNSCEAQAVNAAVCMS